MPIADIQKKKGTK